MTYGKKSYYAAELAKLIGHGCNAWWVGTIANDLKLKGKMYGFYVEDAKASASGYIRHYSTFKYYIEAMEPIRKEYFKRKGLS